MAEPVERAIAEVKAAEIDFNAAENAGTIEGMFKYVLQGRTIFPGNGGRLIEGQVEEIKQRRQAAFDAGLKYDLRIEDLQVRVFGDAAVATFYLVGTVRQIDGTTRDLHARSSGTWVRTEGEWKLAHRHESPF